MVIVEVSATKAEKVGNEKKKCVAWSSVSVK